MIANLSKVIIYVQDMESQVAFYRDLLGLQIESPTDCSSFKNEEWVLFDTGDSKLALHSGGQNRNDQTNARVCFEVDDLQSSRQLLSLKGVHVGEIISPAPGVEVLSATDPEGNLFSLEKYS